jgi:hypothetical protein
LGIRICEKHSIESVKIQVEDWSLGEDLVLATRGRWRFERAFGDWSWLKIKEARVGKFIVKDWRLCLVFVCSVFLTYVSNSFNCFWNKRLNSFFLELGRDIPDDSKDEKFRNSLNKSLCFVLSFIALLRYSYLLLQLVLNF